MSKSFLVDILFFLFFYAPRPAAGKRLRHKAVFFKWWGCPLAEQSLFIFGQWVERSPATPGDLLSWLGTFSLLCY